MDGDDLQSNFEDANVPPFEEESELKEMNCTGKVSVTDAQRRFKVSNGMSLKLQFDRPW